MAYGTTLVDNIQSSTANTPVVFKDGNGTQIGTLCRAWACMNYTGSPLVINASYNVSSITRNGAGDYTINFTNALADSNYSAVATTSYTITTVNSAIAYISSTGKTSSSMRVETVYATGASGAAVNFDYGLYVSVFR